MRILLFSDSHGYTHNMIKAMGNSENIDLIIHLGDFLRDILKIKASFTNMNYEFVPGNNDWTREYPYEKVLETAGMRIFICHGHYYGVKLGFQRIIEKGKELKADAVFFGHTHVPVELYSDGMMLLNPGSVSLTSGSNRPSCCIVEIKEGKLTSRFMSF